MPLLHDGLEGCILQPGTYTLGGNSSDALPLPRLESCPAVATIVVEPNGPVTIQRLTAAVVVWLDRTPLGIAAKVLTDGVRIEFGDCCLTFSSGAQDGPSLAPTDAEEPAWTDDPPRLTSRPAPSPATAPARLVNVRNGESVALGERRVVVGRDDSCDFVVSGMHVSRRHFSIAPVQGGYVLRDESANGTQVNGARIFGTYLLAAGDVLTLEETELRFEVEGLTPPSPTAEAAPTALLDLSYVRNACASDPTRTEPTPHTATLEIVRGRFAGASFVVDRPVCVIGRGPQSDVRIRDESVSTDHATLLRKGAAWFVVDLRSANGTFVDSSRVAGERELADGSRLKLGAIELVFRSFEAADAKPEPTPKRTWRQRLMKRIKAVANG